VPLSIVQANLWRENPSKPEDVALLVSTKADLLNVNEARLFEPLLKQVPGYQTIQPGTGFMLNNAVLVRDGIKVTGFEARQMCDPVNDVAARSATLVRFEFAGKQRSPRHRRGGLQLVLERRRQKRLDLLTRSDHNPVGDADQRRRTRRTRPDTGQTHHRLPLVRPDGFAGRHAGVRQGRTLGSFMDPL
jgi:hypothetical protein